MRPTPLAMALFAALLTAPTAWAETPSSTILQLTENQARSRIEESGYTGVSDLHRDERGLWQGRAARNGDPREVRLDAQGHLEDPWELAALTMFDRETGEMRTAESPAPGADAARLVVQVSR